MQDLFETSNHREYLKCGSKFCKKPISRLQIMNKLNNFWHPKKWSKLFACCQKFILKLIKKHLTGKNLYKKTRNTKIIKPVQ